MVYESKHYISYNNAYGKEFLRFSNLDTLNGSVVLAIKLENYNASYKRVLDIAEEQFKHFFYRQYYNNAILALAESIVYVGRQIFFEATHDEVIFGTNISIVVTLFRENEMIISQVGNLVMAQVVFDTSTDQHILKLIDNSAKKAVFLESNNFHEIAPNTYRTTPSENEHFVISDLSFIADSANDSNLGNLNFDSGQIDHCDLEKGFSGTPFFYIRTKELHAFSHDADRSIFGNIVSLDYFKKIPLKHIGILSFIVIALILVIVLFNPSDQIYKAEKGIFNFFKKEIKHEVKVVENLIDSANISNNKLIVETRDNISESKAKPELESEKLKVPKLANYTVKPNETVFRISKNFNVSINELIRINGIKNNVIYTNQKIKVPVQDVYIVDANKTLDGIAREYNITVQQIMLCNKLSNSTISVGTKLLIPYTKQ